MQFYVTAITKYDPNSYNSVPRIIAVAVDEAAAKKWITEEEVTKDNYAQGHDADWWMEHGYFTLASIPLHGSETLLVNNS